MAKKKRNSEEKKGEGWIVSFADLMTLLFCVFVVLYGLKPEGIGDAIKQIETITTKIREAFNQVPDDVPLDRAAEPSEEGKQVFAYFKGERVSQPIIKRYQRSDKTIAIINEEMQQVKRLIDIKIFDTKKPVINESEEKNRPISIFKDREGFTIKLLSSYFFEPGAYRIKASELEKIRIIGETLRNLDRRIVIEGHTDAIPKEGEISNWELSALRAGSLARYFIDDLGYKRTKIKIAGYADTKPVATNRTSQGRQMNRRVEIKVKYDE